MYKRITLLCFRLLVGGVFVFSGFVKAIDPLGFTYKIEDYLTAMSPFMAQFAPLAFTAAIILSAIELVIGLNLILGMRLKESNWAAAALMLFMTPLTLWIALTNPVHDCGCFGDAWVISNWETFWKNIVLSLLIGGIFFLQKSHKPFVIAKTQWIITAYSFIFSIGLSIYCYQHLPIIDFRPYKIGTNILKGMEIPDNAAQDSFDIKLIYSKNGVEKEFTMENYPQDDSWTFVDQKTTLLKKGYEPPIHDFTMETENGDITDSVLADTGYSFLVVAYDLKKSNLDNIDKLNKVYAFAKKHKYGFYVLTSSVPEHIEAFKTLSKTPYTIGLSDKITLKTIIRSNPGLLLIKDARVLNMWHNKDLPSFNAPLEEDELGKVQMPNNLQVIIFTAIMFLIPLFIIVGIDKVLNNRRD